MRHTRLAKQDWHRKGRNKCVTTVSDFITNQKIGTSKRNTLQQGLGCKHHDELQQFVHTVDWTDKAGTNWVDVFVVFSATPNKTGFAIVDMMTEIIETDAYKRIMEDCTRYFWWSDNGGSLPSEEVAAFLFETFAKKFPKTKEIQCNQHESYHGSDKADWAGSMVNAHVKDKIATGHNGGLTKNLDSLIKYCKDRWTARYGTDFRIRIHYRTWTEPDVIPDKLVFQPFLVGTTES